MKRILHSLAVAIGFAGTLQLTAVAAQVPPSDADVAAYKGLHQAAATGDASRITALAKSGADVNARDAYDRTPAMVAAHRGHKAAIAALIAADADLNALDRDRYDVLTISGVRGDADIVEMVLKAGAKPGQTTSPYDGTALIASAHRGHVDVVKALIGGGAPLDHVNNLNWTALIEAIVLGDGGTAHTEIVRMLVKAGADVNLPDGNGVTPLGLAKRRDYGEMIRILEAAGAKP